MDYRRNYVPGGTYFFTVVTYRRTPLFHTDVSIQLLRECVQHEKRVRPFNTLAWVILPDHLHMIWSLPQNDSDYSLRWSSIKGRFTRAHLAAGHGEKRVTAGKRHDARRGVWQPKFFEHTIRDEDDYIRHVEYIHYNPVKHGLATEPGNWTHSSFHEYVRRDIYESHWGRTLNLCPASVPKLQYEGAE